MSITPKKKKNNIKKGLSIKVAKPLELNSKRVVFSSLMKYL